MKKGAMSRWNRSSTSLSNKSRSLATSHFPAQYPIANKRTAGHHWLTAWLLRSWFSCPKRDLRIPSNCDATAATPTDNPAGAGGGHPTVSPLSRRSETMGQAGLAAGRNRSAASAMATKRAATRTPRSAWPRRIPLPCEWPATMTRAPILGGNAPTHLGGAALAAPCWGSPHPQYPRTPCVFVRTHTTNPRQRQHSSSPNLHTAQDLTQAAKADDQLQWSTRADTAT